MDKNNGLIYVFTGNGKGKTSAAIGAAIRMCGCDGKVGFFQFLKGQSKSHEREVFSQLGAKIDNHVFGVGFFRSEKQRSTQEEAAAKGFEIVKKAILSYEYDLIVIDEINVAVEMNLININDLIELIYKRKKTHLILTGRYAKQEIIDLADLVTEMKEIKHPYKKGIKPVEGIDF